MSRMFDMERKINMNRLTCLLRIKNSLSVPSLVSFLLSAVVIFSFSFVVSSKREKKQIQIQTPNVF